MGLSASQARQIALTARMNDIEYQGQQINEERTTLSNQVNTLYNSLLDLSVPTPPSTSDYTKVTYSFVMGTVNYTMGTVTPDNDGGNYYSVNLNYQATGDYLTQLRSRYFYRDDDGAYHLGSLDSDTILTNLSDEPGAGHIQQDDLDRFINAITNYFPEYEGSTPEQIQNDFYVYFTQEGGRDIPHFVRRTNLDGQTPIGSGYIPATVYDYLENGIFSRVRHYDQCTLTFNTQGIITNIGLPIYDPDTGALSGHDDFELAASTVTDQEAYDQAFNEYETAKYKYDKKQAEINAKTSIIQREDKNLELKLTRLDNERNALKTELEAVKKVVQDAVESGFKTFSG